MMRNKRIIIVIICYALITVAVLGAGFITKGTAVVEDMDENRESFDLDTGKVLKSSYDQVYKQKMFLGDFAWDRYAKGVAIMTTDPKWKAVKDLGKKNISDIKIVSNQGFEYMVPLVLGHVYCVRTKEYNYGLVRFTYFLDKGMKVGFEWKFNFNGGLNF